MIALPQPWPTNPWPTAFRTVRASEPTHLADGLRFLTVQSPALAGRGDLALFVPPKDRNADRPTVLPLVVLLHGVYGSFWNWALNGSVHRVLADLIAHDEVGPMVLAMPSDGMSGEGTAYLASEHADVERWVIDDVPACVREAVAEIDETSSLMLCGNSMGGFGALRIAARHADRVAAVAAHSAITDLDELAQFTVEDVGHRVRLPNWERRVARVIEDSSHVMPPVHLDCGIDDPLIDANRALHAELDRLGVAHTYDEYPGAHDWTSWRERVGVSLRFFDRIARDRRVDATTRRGSR